MSSKTLIQRIIITVICLFCVTGMSAQIVLEPAATGTRTGTTEIWRWFGGGSSQTVIQGTGCQDINPTIYDGSSWYGVTHGGRSGTFWVFYQRGVLEFDLQETADGADFPPAWMTASNWTAEITDLQIYDSSLIVNGNDSSSYPAVNLFDLSDASQDGIITCGDMESGDPIVQLYETRVPQGRILSADVTESLRHDLFGSTRYPTTGFIVRSSNEPPFEVHNYTLERWAENPRLLVHPLNDTPTPTITPTITATITPSPTTPPVETPSPTPTNEITPTPTWEPTCENGVKISMPKQSFSPGDSCNCIVTVCNNTGDTLVDFPLFVALEVAGAYYFGPEFSTEICNYSSIHPDFKPGETEVEIVPTFQWPEGCGSYEGAFWYSCITEPSMVEIFGNLDSFEFSWS